MPIISKIGARSWKVRLIYGTLYAILIAGALSMIYPFALMLSGSFKSDTDFIYVYPYPRFWTDDTLLFQKYCESKYNGKTDYLQHTWGKRIGSWRKIEPPQMDEQTQQRLDDFLAWRAESKMPVQWYSLGHITTGTMLAHNARFFRERLYNDYDGDVAAYARALNVQAAGWSVVVPPRDFMYSRGFRPKIEDIQIPFQDFKAQRPRHDRTIIDLDRAFWKYYLLTTYRDVEEYNRTHGTDYDHYGDVVLSRRIPAEGLSRKDWEKFVREEVSPVFLRLDAGLDEPWRKFLRDKYETVANLNVRHENDYGSFDQISCPRELPDAIVAQIDWEDFIKDPESFGSDHIEIYGPRQEFEKFVAERRGVPVEEVRPMLLPTYQADYHDAMAHKSELRWEFTTRNYRHVLDYILLHGRGIVNTLIYCGLAISGALLVNPLAAYALSRYKPPSQYTVLLFCMATMAFPAAVTMIPNFLLLKRFPLWPILGCLVTFFVAIWLIRKMLPRLAESVCLLISLGVAILVGFLAVPAIVSKPNVSLLNTFSALILPGLANGYFIFLLKGFFDSLPRELYEAADLDGASEWTKFWLLTMNLSKPILAVIALGAFTAAYSQFMVALIIIPDRKMWTLMVWIYQLQIGAHQAVVYASLVLAAIPTFLVFIFCQNIIIRGIVVPTEK